MVIFREFRFEAAHWLPRVEAEHKCARMHGHSYRFVLHISGAIDPERGWVMDFAEMRKIVDPVVEELDHRCLNEVPGLENPTAEAITKWIWDRLKPRLRGLIRIELYETSKCGCVYEGE
ncbi:MAG: 6-carboxytetrahydropterin synthase QueD [Phycisphaeraceae bacterium]|nr:6-carboxytetrahydropterin synthase QueD [Phycisphaeraceae bacterium]